MNVTKKHSASDECLLGILSLLLHDKGGDESKQAVDLLRGTDGALGL
jgi:hypothetical protein